MSATRENARQLEKSASYSTLLRAWEEQICQTPNKTPPVDHETAFEYGSQWTL